jgi:uncharacterized protein (DUF433 family)
MSVTIKRLHIEVPKRKLPVAKKKIRAKTAVEDIRAGMTDAALMKKYELTPEGLQSLLDKLVSAGYLDLGELQERTPFLGTVAIDMETLEKEPPPERKRPLINAQEMARDIRSGMLDGDLMQKYRLSAKDLQRAFYKLMKLGIISQVDLDLRNEDMDRTVDLREELSLSAVLGTLWSQMSQPKPEPVPADSKSEVMGTQIPEKPSSQERDATVKTSSQPKRLQKPSPEPMIMNAQQTPPPPQQRTREQWTASPVVPQKTTLPADAEKAGGLLQRMSVATLFILVVILIVAGLFVMLEWLR